MPCVSGTCEFGDDERAYCKCDDQFSGRFCEAVQSPAKDQEQDDGPQQTGDADLPPKISTVHTGKDSTSVETDSSPEAEPNALDRDAVVSLDEVVREAEQTVSRPIVVVALLTLTAVGILVWMAL